MAVFLRAARRRQLLVLARTHRCNVCSAASAWLKLGRDVGRLAQHCYIKRRRNAPRRFPFNSSASRPSRACLCKQSHSCFERRMACGKTGARRFGKTPPAGRAIGSGSCGAVAWAADPGPAPTPHTTNKSRPQVRSCQVLSCLVLSYIGAGTGLRCLCAWDSSAVAAARQRTSSYTAIVVDMDGCMLSFLSAFPMFVPSLSWLTDHFYT